MELIIKCPHEANPKLRDATPIPRLSDYHPLTKHELWVLLNLASTATGVLVSTIQVRLNQGVRGVMCPREIDGEVAERMNKLDRLYIRTRRKDPRKLPDMVEQFYELMEGESPTTPACMRGERDERT